MSHNPATLSIQQEPLNSKITDFLQSIPPEEVIQLAKTSTAGLIAVDNVKEAITIILRYSDAITLLNRKRIKVSYLAEYLHSRHVKLPVPANKTMLSRCLLRLWGVDESSNYTFDDGGQDSSPLQSSRIRHDSGVITTPVGPPLELVSSSQDSPTTTTHNIQVNHIAAVDLPSQQSTGKSLALQFVPWFYTMLNSLENFESTHFWPRCNLRLEIIQPSLPTVVKETTTGLETHELLKSLIMTERIQFNPNTLNGIGIDGRITPHGQVEVVCCGTAHRAFDEFGRFEQMFSLLRDPQYQNNFKILNSILIFRGNGGGSKNLTNTTNGHDNSTYNMMVSGGAGQDNRIQYQ